MKGALRAEIRERLRARADRETEPILLTNDALSIDSIKTCFAFLSTIGEPDTQPIMAQLLARGVSVAVPRVVGDDLEFRRITSSVGPFTKGAFGIRVPPSEAPIVFPSEADLDFPLAVLVPGVAFDRAGNRLGRGRGYYDRFLHALFRRYGHRLDITLIGFCHSLQVVDRVPVESHDIPVDCLLTEKGAILCENDFGG